MAWLKQGEENQAEVDAHNLAQWTASRAKNETSEGDKTAEETLKEESEVNV